MNPFHRLTNVRFADDPPDDDAENFGAFMNYFGRATKDPKWLDTVKGSLSSGAAAIAETPKEVAGYLSKALDKAEATITKQAEQLDKMRDLLTPEQLTSLRSAPSGEKSKGDPGSPPPIEPPKPLIEPPPKRRKWL